MSYFPGWRGPPSPPFAGAAPPAPPGANLSQWGTGAWQFNPAYRYQPGDSPKLARNNAWTAGSGWHDIPHDGQQLELYGPHGPRTSKPPSAEYLATKLQDNPLGLTNMIPREEFREEDGSPQTPWIWNPPGLFESDGDRGAVIVAVFRDERGRSISQDVRGAVPSRQASVEKAEESSSTQAHPRSNHIPRGRAKDSSLSSGHNTVPQPDQALGRPQDPSSVYQKRFGRSSSSGRESPPGRLLRQPKKPNDECFTASIHLHPTFSTNIVRVPAHYDVPSGRNNHDGNSTLHYTTLLDRLGISNPSSTSTSPTLPPTDFTDEPASFLSPLLADTSDTTIETEIGDMPALSLSDVVDDVPIPLERVRELSTSLAQIETTVHPWHEPIKWSDANRHSIRALLRQTAYFSEGDDLEGHIIYPRLTIHAFAHSKCTRLHDDVRQQLETWRSWDDLKCLLNHRVISEYLINVVRECQRSQTISDDSPKSKHTNDDEYHLERILMLDAVGIYTFVAIRLNDENGYKKFCSLRGTEAQSLLDLLQELLDVPRLDLDLKRAFLRALLKLSRKSGLYPECLVLGGIQQTGKDAVASGSFGDVWKGTVRGQGISMKVSRVYMRSEVESLLKEVSREAVIWRQLSHPNVLPFYGVYHLNDDRARISLISPWMDNGNITQFLQASPSIDRVPLVYDIAQGLEYLHSLNIVHGDLKGVNILISQSCRACLADFGLTRVRDSKVIRRSSLSSVLVGGTLRWEAPELIVGENPGRNTLATDIYSFGCVCYELFSGNVPFCDVIKDSGVILKIIQGARPSRPSPDICNLRGLDDHMWGLIEHCWQGDPGDRPTALYVLEYVKQRLVGVPDQRPPCTWDESFISQFRSSLVKHPPAVQLVTLLGCYFETNDDET